MPDDKSLFEPYAWQGVQWRQITGRFADGRLAHAYLMRGAAGIGKLDFARAFGRYVLCQDKAAGRCCGRCRSCQLNRAGTHPDLLFMEPESPGKGILIGQIRELIEFSARTAQQGGYRVVVLSPAESMNTNAANALLKCLEEPGENTLLILVSHRISAILPTIRSRCQLLTFDKPDEQASLDWLMSSCDNAEQAKNLLVLSGGCPLAARACLENGLEKWLTRMQKDLGAITRGAVAPVEVALAWQDVEPVIVLEWLAGWVAEMISYVSTSDDARIRSHSMARMLSWIAQKAGARRLLAFHAWLLQQKSCLSGQVNLNRQLLVEAVLFRWLQLTMRQ